MYDLMRKGVLAMDSLFEELVGIDSAKAFDFFSVNLREVVEEKGMKIDEMLYVASVLAHYSMIPGFRMISAEPVRRCSEVLEFFNKFVLRETVLDNAEVLEIGASQLLLFIGFFRGAMRRRHNISWYDQLGQSFYDKAAQHSKDIRKRELLGRLSGNFPAWAMACSNLRTNLYENRFLLKDN